MKYLVLILCMVSLYCHAQVTIVSEVKTVWEWSDIKKDYVNPVSLASDNIFIVNETETIIYQKGDSNITWYLLYLDPSSTDDALIYNVKSNSLIEAIMIIDFLHEELKIIVEYENTTMLISYSFYSINTK